MGSTKVRQVINHIWLELKKLGNYIVSDFWVLLLDIISVNLAYFLALMIRYSVKWSFRPFVLETILPAFEQFAPWYTICSIIVFLIFRLYGGLWRYAGLNDFNRIILASICTAAIQILGSSLFVYRMPVSYYILGVGIQLVFTVLIRFGHQITLAEMRRMAKRKAPVIETIVVGMGEIGIQVINQIEANEGIKIVAIVDNRNDGKLYNGIPVIGVQQFISSAGEYAAKNVLITDQTLKPDERVEIIKYCDENKIEIKDYTGTLANMDEAVSVSSILNLIKGKVVLQQQGDKTEYETGYQAQQDLTGRYTIDAIECEENKILLKLRTNQQVVFVLDNEKEEAFVGYDTWAQRKE